MSNKLSIDMKTILYILLLFCFVQEFQAQNSSGYRIINSSLGSGGSSQSVSTSNGTYKISQSIGQASVIGTYHNNGYYLRQGYQQPLVKMKFSGDFDAKLNARVYPNPFSQSIVITFSKSMKKDISVLMFDVNSKIIHSQEFLPVQEIELKLNDISNGIYFLKVASGQKYFNTKLIKI